MRVEEKILLEAAGRMFLQNFSTYKPSYMTSHLKKAIFNTHAATYTTHIERCMVTHLMTISHKISLHYI
jgi:hypothetical protein